jgi:hypothetical protein
MTKPRRTSQELVEAIMHEGNDILSLTTTQQTQADLHHPNWDAAFTMHDPRVVPEGALG